ncbi:putative LRO1-a lecithin cholesterol acyltransferase-like protein [Serendipita vermifera]|nr:putative LRO1-a lecithin cholesterol acyltransferase-like protein [Serendipita vermifera]
MSETQGLRQRKKFKVEDVEEEVEVAEDGVKTIIRRVNVIRNELFEPGVLMEGPSYWKKSNALAWNFMLNAFLLCLTVGFIICALLLTKPPTSLSLLLEEYDLPSLGAAEVEWRELFSANSPLIPWNVGRVNFDGREFCVGEDLSARGLQAKHPVILIPGIISTALENWSTSGEYKAQFRKRYWGGASMVMRAIQNPERWMAALMLDPETGLDPPGVKIRAAQGIDAAQKFIEGYWLWEKILQNLAALNYDTNNLELAAYDWRLSYGNLEVRDGYFSRLKHGIESYKIRQRQKTVIVAHSMGATVSVSHKIGEQNLKWVESEEGGRGGPNWVENHIESVITIGGTLLGVPKAMVAFLSGEMKDTVSMSPAASYVLERYFHKRDRAKLFRSWAGSASMWIKGGDIIWGNETHAPDDLEDQEHTHGHFLSFRPKADESNVPHVINNPGAGNLTVHSSIDWILSHTPTSFQRMIASNYSFGFERNEEKLKANNHDPRKWTNPLEVQLPNAPSLKIYCVYGHGLETERSYWYARGEYMRDDTMADSPHPQCHNQAECLSPNSEFPMARTSFIDHSMTNETAKPKLKNGVKIGEGDGTVSLISLGAMCVEGWRRKRWNPAGIKVVTHEVSHQPEAYHFRGGASSGDHIDILGGTPLNEIVGKVATGAGDEITENLISNIKEYAGRIDWDGGLKTEFVH